MKTLGQEIKLAREAKRMGVTEVAGKLGVSRNAVYKWERDENPPSQYHLYVLTRLLGVNLVKIAATLDGRTSIDAFLLDLKDDRAEFLKDSFLAQIESAKKTQKPE